MMDDTDRQGEYTLWHSLDNTGVVMAFNHIGPDGVEAFKTSMIYEVARDFAAKIIAICDCGQ